MRSWKVPRFEAGREKLLITHKEPWTVPRGNGSICSQCISYILPLALFPGAFSQENHKLWSFCYFFSTGRCKFLHLENHSHYQRGSSRASNLHKHVRVPGWKNPAVMQGAIVIKKERRSTEHVGSRKAQSFEKHGLQKNAMRWHLWNNLPSFWL